MAITLTAAGNERVEYGAVTPVEGAGALTIAFTVTLSASVVDGRRFCGQWAAANADQVFLCQTLDTNEVGFALHAKFGTFVVRGIKTTALNLTSGSTYRIAYRWRYNSASHDQTIYVNGSSASVTDWFTSWTTQASITQDTSASPLYIGYENSSSTDCNDGDYQDYAIWTRYLADEEMAAITNGDSPEMHAEGLALYAPLDNSSSTNDYIGGLAGTATGSPASAESVVTAMLIPFFPWAPAAAGGATIPIFRQHYQGMALR